MQRIEGVKPTLLMLSGCVPDRRGSGEGRRAWQLLQAARRSHKVWLVAQVDQAVNLAQWRALAEHLEQLLLVPGRAGRSRTERFLEVMVQGLNRARFDVALCASPKLMDVAAEVSADLRICDLDIPASRRHHQRAERAAAGMRWWHTWRSQTAQSLEDDASAHSDMLLVRRAVDVAWCEQTLAAKALPLQDVQELATMLDAAHAQPTQRRPIRLAERPSIARAA